MMFENVPAVQFSGSPEPCGQYLPIGHTVACLGFTQNSPGGHGFSTKEPTGQYFVNEHGI